MKKYSIGDRVKHDYLGTATVIGCHKDAMNPRRYFAYTLRTDERPAVRYNGGNRECLAFPSELSPNT